MKVLKHPKIIHIVLDVLKPHQPTLPDFAAFLAELDDIKRVDVTLVERDYSTMNLKVIIDGNVDYESLMDHMAKQEAVIQSIDQIVVE